MWSLTKEKKEALLKERDQKSDELYRLKKKTSQDLWRDDLDGFLKELDVREIIIEHSYFWVHLIVYSLCEVAVVCLYRNWNLQDGAEIIAMFVTSTFLTARFGNDNEIDYSAPRLVISYWQVKQGFIYMY